MTNELTIIEVNNESRIDSRLVAARLEVDHKVIKENIREYKSAFETLGSLPPLETAAVKEEGARGTKYATYYMLNEDQSVFLITLSRNTSAVVGAKLAVTQAFSQARKQPAKVDFSNLTTDQMDMFVGVVSQAKIDKLGRIEAEKQLSIAAPKASKWEKFLDTEGYISSNELAKLLGLRRNKMLSSFRDSGILTNTNLATQSMIDRHPDFFKVGVTEDGYAYTRYSARFIDWYTTKQGMTLVS